MNRFSRFGAILSLTLAPVLNANPSENHLNDVVSVLRAAWVDTFEFNYRSYMIGPSPTVFLIPRSEMIKIAASRLEGRPKDGANTQGLTIEIGEKRDVRIVVV